MKIDCEWNEKPKGRNERDPNLQYTYALLAVYVRMSLLPEIPHEKKFKKK